MSPQTSRAEIREGWRSSAGPGASHIGEEAYSVGREDAANSCSYCYS